MLRYSRVMLTQYLKRLMHDLLGYGLALEGLGMAAETPFDRTSQATEEVTHDHSSRAQRLFYVDYPVDF